MSSSSFWWVPKHYLLSAGLRGYHYGAIGQRKDYRLSPSIKNDSKRGTKLASRASSRGVLSLKQKPCVLRARMGFGYMVYRVYRVSRVYGLYRVYRALGLVGFIGFIGFIGL